MTAKRKRDEPRPADTVHRPEPGTKSFTSGKAVRDGLAVGSRQALVSFHQQIVTPHSQLPLEITHPTILILQHYLDTSPTADEIFKAWKLAEETKSEKLAESAALLLAQVLRVLTPLPFFHTQVTAIVTKLIAPTEPYTDLLGRLLQSGRRDQILAGLSLVAAAINVDKPDPSNLHNGPGRLATKVWFSLAEGGSVKHFGKMLSMRRRTKEGAVEYGDKDPMDRPDIRHLVIDAILPLLPTTQFHSHAKHILSNMYSGLMLDPPTTVYRVLSAMWAAISAPAPGTGRRIALVLLDEGAIDNISKLLDRGAVEPTTNVSVGEMAAGFLEGVTSNPGRGICFPDEGWYPREEDEMDPRKKRGLHNRILSNVVKRLGARVVDDEGRVGAWVLKMFQACPELVSGYWAHSALSLEPRLDARWIATMAYVGRVISLPLPNRSTFNQPAPRGTEGPMPPRASPPEVLTIVESVLPSPLTKTHLSKGLQHSNALVQHVTALALARALQKLDAVQALFASIAAEVDDDLEGPWTTRANELEAECRRRVPEVPVIIAFAQKAATLARPKDEDDEVEPALIARSAMLTEAALRLFGLYHKTLPSLAGEARFDVGKLLVSASSANAERRARREAREGSVVSDSGSVGSVGTLGTVGMGGGFGHSRGDVEGFEALSQLHVLRLLSEVRDWTWTKKAAGSQFTYLYHILQLHLSTRNVVTHGMTTTLLHKLLQPSLLFEHDPLELAIWLDALPRVSDTVSGPMFVAQQIHLLSFIDECVRRALKTPHRYIEEAAVVIPSFTPQQVASPLLLAMVEQLHAKLLGMHIATEAAAVVLNYLRRVLVGLLGKQATGEFVREIVKRISASIQTAKNAGQPRHGLPEVVELIDAELGVVFLAGKPATPDPETPKLVDEADWAARSFTRNCIARNFDIPPADPEENARRAQFLVHFLAARPDTKVLGLIAALLAAKAEGSALRLRSSVFNDVAVRSMFLTSAGSTVRAELAAVAATLDAAVALDRALAEHYAAAAVETLEGKTSNADAFAIALPWVRFMAPVQVEVSLTSTIKRMTKRKSKGKDKGKDKGEETEVGAALLSALVAVSRTEALHTNLSSLLSLGVYDAISARLRAIVASSLSRRLDIAITPSIVTDLIGGKDDAYTLLALLVSLAPEAAKVFATEVETNEAWLEDVRILPAVAEAGISSPAVATASVEALANPALSDDIHTAALALLPLSPDAVNAAIGALPTATFGLPLARAAATMAQHASKDPTAALSPSVSKLLDNGLYWAASAFTSPLAGDDISALKELTSTLAHTTALRVEPNIARAEATIEAAIAREPSAAALAFAAALAPRTMLKAGFIRASLTSLIVPRLISPLSLPAADAEARTAFAKLAHALFVTNTYVSAQPNFIEPLLPFYRGSMDEADQLVLAMFAAFENQRHLSVTTIFRYWGNASGRALDALSALDPGKVFATCSSFPLRRSMTGIAPSTEDIYDPAFVLPLLSAVLMEELAPLDWVEVLRTNAIGLAVCALSSRDVGMRTLAGWLLKTVLEKVHNIGFHEKLQLVHTLELVAHSIEPPATKETDEPAAFQPPIKLNQPRLPTLITLFIAHALRGIAHPAHFIFPLSSRFLLQRPVLDIFDVPMLYGMLYASGDNGRRERGWIVKFLRDGVKSEADYRLLARRNTLSLLSTLFTSSTDAVFRRNILAAVLSIAKIPSGGRAILRAHLPWLAAQWDAAITRPNPDEIRDTILSVLDEAVASGLPGEKDRGKERCAALVARILSTAAKDADPARLEVLARIAFRLAPNTDAVSALVARLGPSSTTATTELLFRTSLYFPTPLSPAAAAAVKTLTERVARLDGGVGTWARELARS